MAPDQPESRGLNSASLEHLRNILITSLPQENIGEHDRKFIKQKKVSFRTAGSLPPSAREDRETRLRNLKDKQNAERQKKLDELKAQALAAQRFRDQKAQERQQRMEENRLREEMRRLQVEQRKKAINDAERGRLESILKRNMEREARIEAKKRNERSSMVFAFGSSTPRNLDPTDSSSTFWGHRRATSTQNISSATASLTRRQSERDLDAANKKRAISVNGLERSTEDMRMSTSMYEIFNWTDSAAAGGSTSTPISSTPAQVTRSNSSCFGSPAQPQPPAGCASGHNYRRRTDLMPTIPNRDSPQSRKPFTRSPGRAYSMSRLDQLAKPRKKPTITADLPAVHEVSSSRPLSRQSQKPSVSRSMSHLAVGKCAPSQSQRPLRKSDSRSMHQLSATAPVPPPRPTRATQLRQQKLAAAAATTANNGTSDASSRPGSSLSQQSTSSVTSSVTMRHRPSPRQPRPISIAVTGISQDTPKKSENNKPPLPKTRASSRDKLKKRSITSPTESTSKSVVASPTTEAPARIETDKQETPTVESKEIVASVPTPAPATEEPLQPVPSAPPAEPEPVQPEPPQQQAAEGPADNAGDDAGVVDMSASFTSKIRISTEQEAKAALAERRRLAREEAERQAELERQRIEEEARKEFERQQREEEQQRLLIEQQRAAEQERLEEAIKEAKRREEEEKQRREEEQRQKLLKEEADRKAREEAERLKAELQKKLENEEKEREARRKRVEAIMLRTRGKTGGNNQTQTDEKEKKNEENKSEKINGSKSEAAENGHKNEKNLEQHGVVDNIIPVDSVKNANNTVETDDTVNSNKTWQQSDLLM